jgi:hypothetical protein
MKTNQHNSIEPSGELAASISDFRSAVTHVADRETARPVPVDWLTPARKRRRTHQQRTALAWACAALLCLATLPWSSSHSHLTATRPAILTAAVLVAPAAESDSALLEQVDADVSEAVPSSLAPLAGDSWGTTSTSSGTSAPGTTLKSRERTNVAH